MKRLFRGVCALLAIIIIMGTQPETVEAETNETLVFHNSEVSTKNQTIFVGQYSEERARFVRLTVPVHTVSMGADFVFTAETSGTEIHVDVLTNLNGDGYYEMVNLPERTLTLNTTGALVPSTEWVSTMKEGERRTLTAVNLFETAQLTARDRVLEDIALMGDFVPNTNEELLYLISAENGDGQTHYYYVEIDASLPSDVPLIALGAGRFDDIMPWDDHWLDVDWAVRAGVLDGASATEFLPDVTATRGQVVQVLYNQAGNPATEQVSYLDVAPTAWYAKAVSWASTIGVVSGDNLGNYLPNREISRQELASILMRNASAQGISTNKSRNLSIYHDSDDVANWAKDAMAWAVATKVLVPSSNGLLNPTETVTRTELAAALCVYDGL